MRVLYISGSPYRIAPISRTSTRFFHTLGPRPSPHSLSKAVSQAPRHVPSTLDPAPISIRSFGVSSPTFTPEHTSESNMTTQQEPRNLSMTELDTKDAKWITLNVIEYQDQDGKQVHISMSPLLCYFTIPSPSHGQPFIENVLWSLCCSRAKKKKLTELFYVYQYLLFSAISTFLLYRESGKWRRVRRLGLAASMVRPLLQRATFARTSNSY